MAFDTCRLSDNKILNNETRIQCCINSTSSLPPFCTCISNLQTCIVLTYENILCVLFEVIFFIIYFLRRFLLISRIQFSLLTLPLSTILLSLCLHPKPNEFICFSRITSPMLLFAVAASLGACYILSLKNAEKKIVIGGHEISLAHQYGAIGILSLPVFYLAGAGAVLFWVLGLFLALFFMSLSFNHQKVLFIVNSCVKKNAG